MPKVGAFLTANRGDVKESCGGAETQRGAGQEDWYKFIFLELQEPFDLAEWSEFATQSEIGFGGAATIVGQCNDDTSAVWQDARTPKA